jgi:hypothetical protein
MDLKETAVKYNCAAEDQHQFNKPTKIEELAKQGFPYQ